MSFERWLAGLPEETNSIFYVSRYLFLLALLDCSSGQVISRRVGRSKTFYLPRQGYKHWCMSILCRSCAAVLGFLIVIFLVALVVNDEPVGNLAAATGVLALNAVTLASVQAILIMLFDSSTAGFVPIILIQLFSLFLSRFLPGAWKLLLPGNWAMMVRTSFYMDEGFPLAGAISIELVLLLLVWLEGWRFIRWHSRKER